MGLRIMIYDNTDIKGWTRQLKEHTPDNVDELIDELDISLGLTHTWITGGWLYRQFGRFDHTKGFSSWVDALTWLNEIDPEEKISEIQFWGHGLPGGVWLNGQILHRNSFNTVLYGDLLLQLRERMTPESLIWFRSCSIFASQKGHDFAKAWSNFMQCRIAAHTYIVHVFQSGLHCIRPGQEPWWPLEEGIKAGTVDRPEKIKVGWLWSPNTILALQSHLPKWAEKR